MNQGLLQGYGEANAASLENIEREAAPIVAQVNQIVRIVDVDGEKKATEFLGEIKARLKKIADTRTLLLKPIKDHVKKIEAEFNRVAEPLEKADADVRQAMIAYRNSQEFAAREAARKQIEAEAKAVVREGDTPTLQAMMPKVQAAQAEAPKKVEADTAEARFRRVWKWEIADLEAIPAAYWCVDEKKVAAAVKAGIAIPGIKAWQQAEPIIV